MPLRILLADESTTIKKAFQLALNDLGAEIKSVPSGLDVMTVTLDFNPHIIFADVLLTKKSGYEVCREITSSNETKNIPVVLMWSNFMEFNTTLANQVAFSDRLEKPFDTAALRKVVTRFYNEIETHPLNGLLEFPPLPEFKDEFTPVQLQSNHENQTNHKAQTNENLIDDFKQHELKNNNSIHIETESHGDFEEVVLVQSNKTRSEDQSKMNHQMRSYLESSPASLNKIEKHINNQVTNKITDKITGQMTNRFDESLIREEVRSMTEKICWQIIPEMAEKLIKAELEKLMKNIEKSI